MQVTLNSLNLNTGNYSLENIQFDSSPPIEFSDLNFASADGAKFISSRYTPKTLTMRGRITQSTVALLEAEMDNFKKTLLSNPNINLNFSYANSFRQYVGNVQNLTLSRKHFNITYVPFEITFIAEDPPFAYDISSLGQLTPNLSEVFSADNIVGNTYSHTLTMSGTAPPLAKWTYLLDAVSGRISQIVFKSITTGKQLELNAALSAGDQVIIDEESLAVLLNGSPVEYEGVFPQFNLGGNEIQWNIYGSGDSGGYGAVVLDQSQQTLISRGWQQTSFIQGQTFTPSVTKNLVKISLALSGWNYTARNLTLKLWNTSGGLPTTLISSSTIRPSTIATAEWIDFPFNDSLTAGTVYAFSLEIEFADPYPYGVLWWEDNRNNYYSGGSMITKDISGSWYFQTNFDTCFKTYYSLVIGGTFDQSSSLKIEQKKRYL